MLDILINLVCDNLDTAHALLPNPTITLSSLGGSSSQILLPHDAGGFRTATVSPLAGFVDAVQPINWLLPVDQIMILMSFLAGTFLLWHSFRFVRWLAGLIRGAGN